MPLPTRIDSPGDTRAESHTRDNVSPDGVLPRCERCRQAPRSGQLRAFGKESVCGSCYSATLEIARGAMKVMGNGAPNRACSNCRALTDPSLGSAWCGVQELGDERARICENFVPASMHVLTELRSGGRDAALHVWRLASEELRCTVGNGNFETWLGALEPVELRDQEILLAVPNQYTRDWLEQAWSGIVKEALRVAARTELRPVYVIDSQPRLPAAIASDEAKAAFNPNYTFAHFVAGPGTELAHASALECAERPGQSYNPLVLYGGVGVGKTHLLQAIGQRAIDCGSRSVLYATSETFTNELIAAIRTGSTREFRERYRGVDFLLLDDIQFIAGKEATQEEFFHTFNALHQMGKQIVLTCDRSPSELTVLADRLRSRFNWGLLADMQPPDFETRVAIARAKAATRGRPLSEEVLTLVAMRAAGNVRELEGALNRLFALADLMESEPNIGVARSVLGVAEPNDGVCRASDVLQAVSAYFRLKVSELASQRRQRPVSYARQVAMYLLREDAKLSLIEIGDQLGGRNHSTVIYSYDKIAGSRSAGTVKQDLAAIRQLMYARR